jgi:hypothetical protein
VEWRRKVNSLVLAFEEEYYVGINALVEPINAVKFVRRICDKGCEAKFVPKKKPIVSLPLIVRVLNKLV